MKILLLDNYDSFTWNLFHYVEQIVEEEIQVKQNNEITIEEVGVYDGIILSPGPGLPDEAGITKEIIRKYSSSKSILGVCLGHQAIAEVFGAKLKNLEVVRHGVTSRLVVIDKKDKMFSGVADDISIGHYHSWVVDKENFPAELNITAEDENGNIMALRHKHFNVSGVQFHPESVLTSYGLTMLKNWLNHS